MQESSTDKWTTPGHSPQQATHAVSIPSILKQQTSGWGAEWRIMLHVRLVIVMLSCVLLSLL